ncbi:MAG: RNA polymerase sigma factor [Gemmatimonadales bacterium]
MTEQTDLRAELEAIHQESFAWAVRCCRGDRTDAEDVLHQSYEKVLDGRARFQGRSAFRTWLFGVIRLTAREHARRQWVSGRRIERWWRERETEPDAPAGPDEELTRRLERALAGLSGRQREVLHLVFYQDLTIEAAAEVLGMPVGTARTHYQRGKDRLRKRLGEEGAVE